MSLPASITGVRAKKQGEDLADNDGDEDEGISHGEQDGAWFPSKKNITVL